MFFLGNDEWWGYNDIDGDMKTMIIYFPLFIYGMGQAMGRFLETPDKTSSPTLKVGMGKYSECLWIFLGFEAVWPRHPNETGGNISNKRNSRGNKGAIGRLFAQKLEMVKPPPGKEPTQKSPLRRQICMGGSIFLFGLSFKNVCKSKRTFTSDDGALDQWAGWKNGLNRGQVTMLMGVITMKLTAADWGSYLIL